MRNPFMPFINDFEKEAEKFLTKYGLSEYLITPGPVPILDVIRKMSLEIVDTEKLSKNNSVEGIIAFSKGIVDIFDEEVDDYSGFEITEPSILIDRDIVSEKVRNAIFAHEAFHWYKHRAYFVFKSSHGGTEFAFRCTGLNKKRDDSLQWSDEEKMEWQARKITSIILLPKVSMKNKIIELEELADTLDMTGIDRLGYIASQLSDFYNVPITMVLERLEQLGYNFTGFRKKEEIFVKQKNISRRHNETFEISLTDAFELYLSNKLFRELINTGVFLYVQNRIVLNKKEYICHEEHRSTITDIAVENPSVCMLCFGERLIPLIDEMTNGVMFQKDRQYTLGKTFLRTPGNITLQDEAYALIRDFENILSRKQSNLVTANDKMWAYIKNAKWNTTSFQYNTLLSPMDYTRIQKSDYTFKLPAYMAMAVGLGLTQSEFEDVIRPAGLGFKDGDREHEAYRFILNMLRGKGIDECNAFLESVGVKPLGTHERE